MLVRSGFRASCPNRVETTPPREPSYSPVRNDPIDINARTRVSSFRKGMTQYGFPSTLNAGKNVPLVGDHDSAIENAEMVTKHAPM